MMQTGYSGVKGNCPRYVCARAKQLYGGEKGCQSIGGRRLEQRVLDEVFAVLAPAALAATGRALAGAEQAHAATLRAFELAAERARYEAGRARRQHDAVEPENRLVARTLERAPENKLAAQPQAERDLISQQARRPVQLTGEELAWLARAGADMRAVFNAPGTTFRERKQLLRAGDAVPGELRESAPGRESGLTWLPLLCHPVSAGARWRPGRSSSALAGLRGLHLATACAPAVTWQLSEAGPKARSAQLMCPRFQGNP
jgi:hypothetical protein